MSKAAPLGLSPKAASRIRRITVLTVALLALSAAILSFSGLLTLALEAGFAPELAWLFPIMIDGMIIVGSLGVIASSLAGVSTWYMWLLTLLGVAASVVGNIAAAPGDLLSQTVHAAPPLVFALSVEGLLRVYRTQAAALIAGELSSSELESNMEQIQETKILTSVADTSSKLSTTTPRVEQSQKASENPTQIPKNNKSTNSTSDKTAKERIAELLESEPDISGSEAARRLGIDPSYARKTIRTLRSENSPETTNSFSKEIDENHTKDITTANDEQTKDISSSNSGSFIESSNNDDTDGTKNEIFPANTGDGRN